MVALALEPPEPDPVLITFIAASVYSAVNWKWGEVTDDDERAFVRALAESLAR